MLYFNLTPIFKARQIDKPYTFLVNAGIAPQTATKIINNRMHVMRLSHIEILCRALYCEPNELLAWKPDTNHPLPQTHPLYKFVDKNENMDWQQQLKTMPLSKLSEISKLINQDLQEPINDLP